MFVGLVITVFLLFWPPQDLGGLMALEATGVVLWFIGSKLISQYMI